MSPTVSRRHGQLTHTMLLGIGKSDTILEINACVFD